MELRKIWYEKLETSGFKDIERPDGSLAGRRFYPPQYQEIRDYFDLISEFLNQDKNLSVLEVKILSLYLEGKTVKQICQETDYGRTRVKWYLRNFRKKLYK